MPNFRFEDPDETVSSEYILVIDRPVIFSPNALLHGWESLRKNDGIQRVVSCSPGKGYSKLSMRLCANPCFNFIIRLWCKMQVKLPLFFAKRAVMICRTDGQSIRWHEGCGLADRTGKSGLSGISGNSGFRVLYL